jgi:hypothetical protein
MNAFVTSIKRTITAKMFRKALGGELEGQRYGAGSTLFSRVMFSEIVFRAVVILTICGQRRRCSVRDASAPAAS